MQNYLDLLRHILDTGTDKTDRTGTGTRSVFGYQLRYDLSKGFPLVTTKKVHLKSIIYELLWFLKGDTNIKYLNDNGVTIWDEWADTEGSIGKAYGYQMSVKHRYKEGDFDQVDRVLYDLKNNPFSRRIMTNIYVHADLFEMNLYPCAYSMTFNVTAPKPEKLPEGKRTAQMGKEGDDRLVLNAVLNQRSNDILTANAWNVTQYAVLVHMFAQVSNMQVGELVHMIADAHIYDRHIPLIKELISRTPQKAPDFILDPEIKDFYSFTKDSVRLENYEVAGEQLKDIPVAI